MKTKKKLRHIKSIDLEVMYKKSYPDIDRIIWNKPAVVIFLKSGEKGIAKVQVGDKWNRELGFWVAYAKALLEYKKKRHIAPEWLKSITIKHSILRPVEGLIEFKGILPYKRAIELGIWK